MISVRNSFQLKFGKAKDAKAVVKDGMRNLTAPGLIEHRAFLDVTGPFYTLILENTWESMGAFEKALADMGTNKVWQEWYMKLMPLVESGHREIYSVIEQ